MVFTLLKELTLMVGTIFVIYVGMRIFSYFLDLISIGG